MDLMLSDQEKGGINLINSKDALAAMMVKWDEGSGTEVLELEPTTQTLVGILLTI
jgi:hypothetical protein